MLASKLFFFKYNTVLKSSTMNIETKEGNTLQLAVEKDYLRLSLILDYLTVTLQLNQAQVHSIYYNMKSSLITDFIIPNCHEVRNDLVCADRPHTIVVNKRKYLTHIAFLFGDITMVKQELDLEESNNFKKELYRTLVVI
jgi:hypothetical protein